MNPLDPLNCARALQLVDWCDGWIFFWNKSELLNYGNIVINGLMYNCFVVFKQPSCENFMKLGFKFNTKNGDTHRWTSVLVANRNNCIRWKRVSYQAWNFVFERTRTFSFGKGFEIVHSIREPLKGYWETDVTVSVAYVSFQAYVFIYLFILNLKT